MYAFYANTAIDSIQNAKTTFLTTFVKDEAFRKPAQDFVSAQTVFAKSVVKSFEDFTQAFQKVDYKDLFSFTKV